MPKPSDEVRMFAPRSCERAIVPRSVVLPPPPPGCRYVSLRRFGTVIADDDLRKRVEGWFHVPMIVLGLLVLPLLLLDFAFIREGVERIGGRNAAPTGGWLWWLVIGGLTLIWIAFTLEFIIKIAIAERRWEYLRRNWLDLMIIVIPLLRPLRVAAVARSTNAFRLRGVGFKLARYVFTLFIGMEASNRLLKRLGFKPGQTRPKPEEMTRHQLMSEVVKLRRLTDDWNEWHAAQQEFLAGNGHAALANDHPIETVADAVVEAVEAGADDKARRL